jgi:hypothetical protein
LGAKPQFAVTRIKLAGKSVPNCCAPAENERIRSFIPSEAELRGPDRNQTRVFAVKGQKQSPWRHPIAIASLLAVRQNVAIGLIFHWLLDTFDDSKTLFS